MASHNHARRGGGDPAIAKVQVLAKEAGELTPPETCCCHEKPQCVEAIAPDVGNEGAKLLR